MLAACSIGLASAGELSRSLAEVGELKKKIDSLQQTLNANIASEKSVTAKLDQLEFAQSNLRKEITKKQSEKAALEADLADLQVQSTRLSSESEDAKTRLAGLLKSGYLLGKQSALRMFVNQQDPHTAARRLTMFNYVIEARNRQLQRFEELQQSLAENRIQTSEKQLAIQNSIAELDAKKTSLAEKETKRLEERKNLQLATADASEAITGYKQRQKSLEKLIKQLSRPKPKPKPKPKPQIVVKTEPQPSTQAEAVSGTVGEEPVVQSEGEAGQTSPAGKALASEPSRKETETARSAQPPVQPMTLAGFGKAKGRLPRPLSAKVEVRFGDKKQESGLRWDGVLFGAKNKQAVKVIYPGQVVFSDWFRGYGQLMVVDHGEGYMSLYGHNQQLTAAVGDQVQSGQTIAMASDAADRPLPGLYFEIRHNGTPDDPLKWIR